MPRISSVADKDELILQLKQQYIANNPGMSEAEATQAAIHAADQRAGYYGVGLRTNAALNRGSRSVTVRRTNEAEEEFNPDTYITETLGGLIGGLAPSQANVPQNIPSGAPSGNPPSTPVRQAEEAPKSKDDKTKKTTATSQSSQSKSPLGKVAKAAKVERAPDASIYRPGMNRTYTEAMLSIEEEFGIK